MRQVLDVFVQHLIWTALACCATSAAYGHFRISIVDAGHAAGGMRQVPDVPVQHHRHLGNQSFRLSRGPRPRQLPGRQCSRLLCAILRDPPSLILGL